MQESQSYNWQALEASAQQPIYIRSEAELKKYCDHWLTLPMIAIDTEFQRVDTFYPIPGLIQVADDQCCYLIDPLSIEAYGPLIEVFTAASVVKVLHAGSEDLELFKQLLGVLPRPLFDTQIAAAFLGWGFTMGLQRMLESVLGIELGKAETTSNWLRRPLSANQELYAALDVAYLAEVWQRQVKQMQQRGCYEWFLEDSEKSIRLLQELDDTGESYYLRFSQMWNIPPIKLRALSELTTWRETLSRERDVPRNRVLRNQTILSIINRWPKNLSELSRADEILGKTIRQDGEQIIAILQEAKQLLLDKGEARAIDRPLDAIWNKRLKKLKQLARAVAEERDMAPELLLRKKDLDGLVRSKEVFGEYRLPDSLSGWRESLIGEQLLSLMAPYDE